MRVAAAFGIAMALAAHANAQELEAIRPGLMCHSAAALATLTLPNGDSRTHRTARPADSTTAAAGGCIDIPLGARVTVLQAFHNTSIVTYGPSGTPPYVIPNIDFQLWRILNPNYSLCPYSPRDSQNDSWILRKHSAPKSSIGTSTVLGFSVDKWIT